MIRKDTDPIDWVLFAVGTIIIFAVAVATTSLLAAGMVAINFMPELAWLISMGTGTLGFLFCEFWLITEIFYE